MSEHASQAVIGWGSVLGRGNADGPPETFTEVSEVTAFQPPQDTADEIEVSHFGSPGARKEYIAGMVDSGECTCTIQYRPAVYAIHRQLALDAEARDLHNWQFELPDDEEVITFRAFIKQFNRKLAPSDKITADITFRVSTVSTEIAT
jgi:hypothetical protein